MTPKTHIKIPGMVVCIFSQREDVGQEDPGGLPAEPVSPDWLASGQ